MKKIVFSVLGSLFLVLGTIGIFLPVLPTVPFYLLTVFFYADSSQRLHDWFVSTDLYKNNLESYVKKEGMSVSTKVRIIVMVSLLMGLGIFMMARKQIWIPCIILAAVWVCHIIYFVFIVKTTDRKV